MKRSLLSTVTALVIVFILSASCFAANTPVSDTGKTVVSYGDWMIEKINGDAQWELDSYQGDSEVIYTPRIINNMLVVSFGSHCFANNATVKSIVTSSPLWTIGDYAFIDCTALESFEFNYALNSIGVGAFSGTKALKNANLEDSVVTVISDYAFADSGLEEVALPTTCEKIGKCAFVRCTELLKITIPESVTEIADDAFEGCEELVIYCYTDSYAHEYAEAKGISYVLIDAPVEYSFKIGDTDGDGRVTILDATKIQRMLAGLAEDEDGKMALRAAGGESLSIMHATRIQRYLAGFTAEGNVGGETTVNLNA